MNEATDAARYDFLMKQGIKVVRPTTYVCEGERGGFL